MAPKTPAAGTAAGSKDKNALTVREQEVIALAWQCFESEPKLDIEKLAELAGFGNPKSASNCWGAIKKKLGFASATKSPGVSATPATGKRAKIEANDDDDNETETPTKKAKTKKSRTTKAVKAEEDDADDGADAIESPVKKEA